jgi:hypothetical protein
MTAALPLRKIYDDVAFPARPRRVRREGGPPDPERPNPERPDPV